jgi:chromate transporter
MQSTQPLAADETATARDRSWLAVFLAFLRLGLTSFGGPVAHLGYFRAEFVTRRRWLDEAAYGDIIALCQFLPGPASSQVGITLGILRAGL